MTITKTQIDVANWAQELWDFAEAEEKREQEKREQEERAVVNIADPHILVAFVLYMNQFEHDAFSKGEIVELLERFVINFEE